MLIGYFCADLSDGSDRTTQRRALVEAGCAQVVEELPDLKGGGEQPELHGLLARLRAGDVVVVPHLNSLGRSLPDVVRRVQRLTIAGAGLRSLAEAFDAAVQDGAAAATVDGLSAHDGQNARQLTGAGRSAAPVTRRRAGGRPPKLSPEQQAKIAEEVLRGRSTASHMARDYGVSEATVSRLLATRRAGALTFLATGQAEEGAAVADPIAGVLPFSALNERLAIVGASGSGKTYAAKGLLERVMAGGGRVCVVDPLGVWWGLREGSHGEVPPFPVVVFGGPHGDVPVTLGMAAILGQLIGTHPLACVVDVSDLGNAAACRMFVAAFIKALHRSNTEPLHFVLDEADLWAPQQVNPGGHDLLRQVENVLRRGRVRGFVPWLITQRPSVLNKDVLNQTDILVSMKLTSSQDREAVGRWIEYQAERAEGRRILHVLPELARGEGWVWAPGNNIRARISFPRIHTLDSSQKPQRRMQASAPCTLAPVDLSAIRAALAAMAAKIGSE